MQHLTTAPAPQPAWLDLPAGVLQRIFCLASTWETPGTCLAAPVCRTWRTAAAGCRGNPLLYRVGRPPAEKGFCRWLKCNSPQLGALILTYYPDTYGAHSVLEKVADTAAAAQAAGAPLPLHTLRVLGSRVELATAGKLLASLPKLHTLQMHLSFWAEEWAKGEALAPLPQATQLRQLYLDTSNSAWAQHIIAGIAELLPRSLQRLSWKGAVRSTLPDLSHLTQLTFLQLRNWEGPGAGSEPAGAGLSPNLQQLEVLDSWAPPEVLEQQQQLVRAWRAEGAPDLQQQLSRFNNLQQAFPDAQDLLEPSVSTALAQHTSLSAVELSPGLARPEELTAALGIVASINNLRSLQLNLHTFSMAEADALSALTSVTRLRAHIAGVQDAGPFRALAAGISGMVGLRSLTVSKLLLQAGWAWLGDLQQLRVVHLFGVCEPRDSTAIIEWLEGWSQQGLPPQLQLLGCEGMFAGQAIRWRLRHHAEALLSSAGSRCEVVVGAKLWALCEPTQQLAGLPMALQQALA